MASNGQTEATTTPNKDTTDESVQVQPVANTPAHPMPEHFPEVQLDDDTGAVTISAPSVKKTEPARDVGATIVATPSPTTTTTTPVAPVMNASQPVPAAPYAPADAQIIQPNYGGYQAEKQVCVRCGSTNLSRGYVVDFSDKFQHLHFAPRKMSTRRLNWAIRPFRNLTKLSAVACRDCGAVLLVADPHELRKTERRRED